MAMPSLYRRVLPSPPAVEFASSEGKRLFSEAIQNGTMEGFFKLISYFQTQSEPAYCGLASVSMVLNALSIDPGRKWKGPWRWFDESMLDCCEPLETVKDKGITFGKVACLASCAGAKVEAFRTTQSNVDDFRKHVIKCTSSDDCHLIASYHRKPFEQVHAHFKASKTTISALYLDTFQVKDDAGMNLWPLSCRHDSWIGTAKYLIDDVPLLLKSETLKSVSDAVSIVLESLPPDAMEFIKWVAEVRRQEDTGSNLSKEEKGRLSAKEEVLQQVHETELFKTVTECLSSASSCCRNISSSKNKDALTDIAASICCQGAELLSGTLGYRRGFCCGATCVRCLKVNGDQLATVISGTVVSGGSKQVVDILVPVSQADQRSSCSSDTSTCVVMHPVSNDIFTVLLLALLPQTWSGIIDEKLLREIQSLVNIEAFLLFSKRRWCPPILLQLTDYFKRKLRGRGKEERLAVVHKESSTPVYTSCLLHSKNLLCDQYLLVLKLSRILVDPSSRSLGNLATFGLLKEERGRGGGLVKIFSSKTLSNDVIE
ncbi:Glutathione gamma-glutamylcysteinyltransferase 1 [Acorus calamus]|uniref:glutathione gamma-glutamylcysteinyltransferase n=1 Tax=Acorus calamus TaxID=4465 RepID=A0AAV9CN87_ACOCL|nr:Glutathione gamma-glutamylcysteinyltransferase 1 [Acorus calamus]